MQKYTKDFILIHWIHALILAFLLIGATLKLPDLPKVSGDLAPFKMHIIIGIIAILLLVFRLILLKKQPYIKLYNGAKQVLVDINHRLIYLIIFIVGISGVATAKLSNLGSIVLFGADASNYLGETSLVKVFANIHSISTTVLMALIAMHIVGVILYTIKTKDKVIKRMWF